MASNSKKRTYVRHDVIAKNITIDYNHRVLVVLSKKAKQKKKRRKAQQKQARKTELEPPHQNLDRRTKANTKAHQSKAKRA